MFNKIAAIFKNIGLILIFLFGIISCEKDFEDIGVELVDNQAFSVGDSLIEIISYTVNVDSSRVDNNNSNKTPLYLLGVNHDAKFGHMKSAVISQMFLPLLGVSFGDNPIIDEVVLDIPYFATRDSLQNAVDPISGEEILDEEGNPIPAPSFTLDSIYGNRSQEFNITVNELGTYLNKLDPIDPTKFKSYFSDKHYWLKDQIYSGDFITNRNDTVLYVERKYLDDDPTTVDDIDTIVGPNSAPSMKFKLDNQFFKTRFVDQENSGYFDSNDEFIRYFRGLYVDANGFDGALINLAMTSSRMTIYYTNDRIEDEDEDEDLNNNGITGETGVIVKTKQSMTFSLGGVKTGKYIHDYSNSEMYNALMNPDKLNGEQKLFVQGAAGSEVIIDLFSEESLEELRAMNWLINEANITIYLDENQNDEVPNQLFLYNYDNNSTLIDYRIQPPEIYGGVLEYDSDGNPEKYKFRISEYISRVLQSESPLEPSKLSLKNFQVTDIPAFTLLDTVVNNYNWIPKGVVLKGNLPIVNEERIKLEIYYSQSLISN